MFKVGSFITVAFIVAALSARALAEDGRWFFTAQEITNAYQYQQQFGARLRSPLEAEACFEGKEDFAASYQGKQFRAPCRFVSETMRQLRELLESGAARYLFPLDIDAADLAVPAEVYASKFKQLPGEEILPALLREPTLVTLYRTAVHLKSEAGNAAQRAWGHGRAVAGFYDGRSNRILSPGSDGRIDFQSHGLVRLGSFTVMNHFLGALSLVADETVVTFDLSFENDRAAALTADVIAASAGKK